MIIAIFERMNRTKITTHTLREQRRVVSASPPHVVVRREVGSRGAHGARRVGHTSSAVKFDLMTKNDQSYIANPTLAKSQQLTTSISERHGCSSRGWLARSARRNDGSVVLTSLAVVRSYYDYLLCFKVSYTDTYSTITTLCVARPRTWHGNDEIVMSAAQQLSLSYKQDTRRDNRNTQ